MGASLGAGLVFLLDIIFEIAKLLMLIRLLMELSRIDFFNPFAQSIAKLTSPVLKPFRMVPYVGHFNTACFLIYWLLCTAQIAFKYLLVQNAMPAAAGLLLLGAAEAIHGMIILWMIVIFVRVILSWVPFLGSHPMVYLISKLASPVLNPVARLLPPMGGLDFSPILALIALKFVDIVVTGGLKPCTTGNPYPP